MLNPIIIFHKAKALLYKSFEGPTCLLLSISCGAWYAMRRLEQFVTSKDKLAFPYPLSMQLPSLYKWWPGQRELQSPHKNIPRYDCFVGRHCMSQNRDSFVAQVRLPHGAMQWLWSFQTPLMSTRGITRWYFWTFLLQWKCFEKTIVGHTKSRQPKKKIRKVYKHTIVSEFLDYLKPNFTKFVTHNFVARWQDFQCHTAMSDLPKDTILSHIDFAENYSFKIQNEIQSMHWFSHQVKILVYLTYKINPLFDPEVSGLKWIKKFQSYISDDKE